jgi:nucleotide-binding universal stress UspA family protein
MLNSEQQTTDLRSTAMQSHEIIVGIDGGAASRAALRWAAADADRTGTPLRVLLAYQWRVPGMSVLDEEDLQRTARDIANMVVQEALAEARSVAPKAAVTGSAVLGDPAVVLLGAAATARLLVVGTRGFHGFSAALVGSVSQQVALHAPCPVTVVRGNGDLTAGPVVVGVDDSPTMDRALRQAFDEAQARHCTLKAVRAFATHTFAGGAGHPVPGYDHDEIGRALESELRQILAPWIVKYPLVPVEPLAIHGNTANVLVGSSREAQLVVVGDRGHGGFAGLLLGSTALHLLQHAACPVLITRRHTPFTTP